MVTQLAKYGKVKRVGASDPAANSVAFAVYRDPRVPGQPALRPRPGQLRLGDAQPRPRLHADQRQAAARRGRGGAAVGQRQLRAGSCCIDKPAALPTSVLNFFLDYATPGFTQEGPTAAVYNHGWVIGDPIAISVGVQAQMDNLLEAVPQK